MKHFERIARHRFDFMNTPNLELKLPLGPPLDDEGNPDEGLLPAPPPATRAEAGAAMLYLRDFIGKSQLACVASGMRGEERQYFYDKMVELAALIKAMPHTYQQDGLGENAIVSLHYFTRGCDWFITEKDMGCADDAAGCRPGQSHAAGCRSAQHQAFGWADLGDRQCAELGYISIVELLACGAELDFHFKPKTLAQAKKEKYGDDN